MSLQPRKVLEIVVPQSVLEGAGVRLKRSIATGELNYLDPFLLFDHFGSDNPDDRFLLISGKPLYEPIVRYGPFVMNTVEEIEQALRDLRNGTLV